MSGIVRYSVEQGSVKQEVISGYTSPVIRSRLSCGAMSDK
jgi:hypothetical protein